MLLCPRLLIEISDLSWAQSLARMKKIPATLSRHANGSPYYTRSLYLEPFLGVRVKMIHMKKALLLFFCYLRIVSKCEACDEKSNDQRSVKKMRDVFANEPRLVPRDSLTSCLWMSLRFWVSGRESIQHQEGPFGSSSVRHPTAEPRPCG